MRSTWLLILLSFAMVGSVNAGIITGNLTADNKHTTYISTSQTLAGEQVAFGDELSEIESFSYNLETGVDYFLHIFAQDEGNMGAVLGEFFLTGGGHEFANGQNTIYTNNTDWLVKTNGWDGDELATSYAFNDGKGPWTEVTDISSSAQWIWNGNLNGQEQLYLSLAILAIPVSEPSTLAVLALLILAIVIRQRMKKQ